MRARILVAGLAVLAIALADPALQADRMSPELLWRIGRVSGGVLSPDESRLAYLVRRYDLTENKGRSELHVVDLESREDRLLVEMPSISDAQWATTPAGLRLLFVASAPAQEGSGAKEEKEEEDENRSGGASGPQVFALDPEGGEATPLTQFEGGVSNLKVSPRGDHIAFTRDVKMDATVAELYPDLPKADARIIDSLLYRHWNAWHDFSYSHVFVARLGEDGNLGEAVDLLAGRRADCPLPPFGGSEQFAWAPDGRELALTLKLVANPAESTDSNVYTVSLERLEEGPPRLVSISTGGPGYDTEPVYSPSGREIAFHSMERAGFESDRNRIFVYDRASGATVEWTEGLDQTAHGATWAPDARAIYFTSESRGTTQIFRVDRGVRGATRVSHGRFDWSLLGVSRDGSRLYASRMSMLRPHEILQLDAETGEAETLTSVNDELFEPLELPQVEERRVRASDGASIHNWVIYPPDFDPGRKWPLIVYCQGGPQGQIGQWFSYRWNFHLMAAQGYVVLAVNRRGLPGFGRAWNDEISRDWGGQAMRDILAATDDVLTEPWADPQRVSAVGASFGGYTVYWLMGNSEDRFACMISHCGVFNLESMYGSTEELFFVNWDLGGPYWRSDALQRDYDRFSPHRFVGRWRTPLLVIHGEKDFRVPVTQGMEAFTAAQVEGVPSRFLYFPEEGHWVLSPQNGVLWHRVFFDWLSRHDRKPPGIAEPAGDDAE